MKSFNKKTWMHFKEKSKKSEAIDFLLKINIPFRSGLGGNWIEVAPVNFKKHHLDLYLSPDLYYSTFLIKFK